MCIMFIGVYHFNRCIPNFWSFIDLVETEKSLNFEFSNKKRQILPAARNVARIPNISSLIPGDYALCIPSNYSARLTGEGREEMPESGSEQARVRQTGRQTDRQ